MASCTSLAKADQWPFVRKGRALLAELARREMEAGAEAEEVSRRDAEARRGESGEEQERAGTT